MSDLRRMAKLQDAFNRRISAARDRDEAGDPTLLNALRRDALEFVRKSQRSPLDEERDDSR